jgi:chromosome segregation ATPase
MRGLRRILMVLCGAQAIIIGALLLHARAMQNETTMVAGRLRAAESAPNALSTRIALLKGENERIQKDLASIPALREESKRIQSEMAAGSAQEIALWAARTNRIQTETELTRQRIAEIEAWEANYNRMQLKDRAAARQAEQAREKSNSSGDASDEYRNLETKLKQIAEGMSRQLAVRRDWASMEKTSENRDVFKSRMGEAWTNFDTAMKQLGKDIDLFEQLPIKPGDANSKMPFLRSLLPDLHGVTATLYLDGTVVWSPPLSEALK